MPEENHDEQHENRIQRVCRHRVHLAVAFMAIVVGGLAVMAWLTARNGSSGAGFGSGPQAVAVTTARATKHTAVFSIYKTVYVLPTLDAILKPEQAGWVRIIRVRPGGPVKAGQEVASLQQVDNDKELALAAFEAAQQDLQIARAEVSAAQGNLDANESALNLVEQRLAQAQNTQADAQAEEKQAMANAKTAELAVQKYSASIQDRRDMFKQGIISRQELQQDENALKQAIAQQEQYGRSADAARSKSEMAKKLVEQQQRAQEQAKSKSSRCRSTLVSARAEVSRLESALHRARAEMESAKRSEQILSLRSPVDGVVSRIAVKTGSLVTPASEVLSVKPLNTATVAFDATDEEVARLRVGMSVLVQRAGNTRPLPGAITSIPTIADGGTKSRRVLIRAKDPANSLKPGNRAVAQVILRKAPAVAVPLSAVTQSKEGAIAWIVSGGKAKSAPVTLLNSGKDIAVVQGIRAGEVVVVQAARPIEEGVPVVAGGNGRNANRE